MTRGSVLLAVFAAGLPLLLIPAGVASAATVTVGSGSSVDLGDGSLDLGCADLDVAGTMSAGAVIVDGARDVTITASGVLNGDSATLRVAGDWDNSGTFNADTSTVRMIDGCSLASSTVVGDTTFNNLRIITNNAKLVSFTAGSTTTVSGAFRAIGEDGSPLQIRSTAGGSEAFLVAQGSTNAEFVDVMDNVATGGNVVFLDADSIKGTNSGGWILAAMIPVLSPWGLGALGLFVASLAGRRLGRRRE